VNTRHEPHRRSSSEALTPATRRLTGTALAVVVIAALLVALLAYGLVAGGVDSGIDDRLAEGRAAPAVQFSLPVLQRGDLREPWRTAFADGELAPRELRGTPFVLNFWASWCPPCRSETPRLERAWRDARPEGVLMLGLNMQDFPEDARSFLAEFEVSYPNVRDRSDEVGRKWGVTGLPETFFIDARGRVVGHVIGEVSAGQLNDGIAAARAGRVLGDRQGGDRRSTR
jgi:cytochrome c biogenesis protein CcmG/thiol:disulfide interchange protein DsbE